MDVPSTLDAATVPSIEMLYLSAFSTADHAKCHAFCKPVAVISVGELSCTVFALYAKLIEVFSLVLYLSSFLECAVIVTTYVSPSLRDEDAILSLFEIIFLCSVIGFVLIVNS